MKLIKMAMGMSLLALSLGANAAFVLSDYKVEGDNQVVLHEETGIEWLNITQTAGMSIDDVVAQLDGQFSGWRLPTLDDMYTMESEYFGLQNELSRDAGSVRNLSRDVATAYNELFGYAFENANGTFSRGLHLGVDEGVAYRTYVYAAAYRQSTVNYNQSFNATTSYSDSGYGVYLVSDGGATYSSLNDPTLNANNANAPVNNVTVPEPASLAILSAGLMGFAFSRRKSKGESPVGKIDV